MAKTIITQPPKKFSVLMIIISIGTALLIDTQSSSAALPELDSSISPLHLDNRHRLKKRLVAAFDKTYEQYLASKQCKAISDNFEFYYFRQELQALLDMYYATSDTKYLKQAKFRSLSAIDDAIANTSPLKHHGELRGKWPCFNRSKIIDNFYGHGQLNDFQGSAGLMMVAKALKEAQDDSYKKIADFVETSIITKWLFYNPSIKPEYYSSSKSNETLLVVLDNSRDKREHFASVCMDLNALGYNKYPYRQWAALLTDIYLSERANLNSTCPVSEIPHQNIPKDWGVIPNKSTNGYIWYWMIGRRNQSLSVQDTSHANRTVWLATKAYSENLIDHSQLNRFINTLKYQVWAKNKGSFYFNNFIDGTDTTVQSMGPGLKGNIWFGWHRLAAYDDTLKDLYISIAYDLTNGGPNVIGQNKAMKEAQLCFFAWAARLLAENGQPGVIY